MRYADCAAADRGLLAAMRDCGGRPGVAGAARALSHAGEHGALWLAAGLAGAAVDHRRRSRWLRATALIGTAHLASLCLKWTVRRARPGPVPVSAPDRRVPASGTASPGVPQTVRADAAGSAAALGPLVRTAGPYSFPSSHATSAAAAAVVFGALLPAAEPAVAVLAAAMCVSRLVVGVHYPSDVAAGAALGGLAARLGSRWTGGRGPCGGRAE
ncbi:phosphatase PAP2 family protein [Streptomyces amakusaensis]|uniref:Phosphatase PAP2 family protein n=1 Tax=Streptomyces amakusaensis TaxID=67271 RepID=A0ABW0AGH2_9ACTN